MANQIYNLYLHYTTLTITKFITLLDKATALLRQNLAEVRKTFFEIFLPSMPQIGTSYY